MYTFLPVLKFGTWKNIFPCNGKLNVFLKVWGGGLLYDNVVCSPYYNPLLWSTIIQYNNIADCNIIIYINQQ